MGSELVLKKIKNGGIGMTAAGVIFVLAGLFFVFIGIVAEDVAPMLILGMFPFIIGVLFLIFGIKNLSHPERSSCIKHNPDLLRQADELFMNIKYEDKFMIISDRVLASKKNITQMCWLEDVYLVYQHTQSMNFISYVNELIIGNKRKKNRISISVYCRGKNTVMNIMQLLSQCCPNSRFGYTPENMAYLVEMQDRYEQSI